MPDRSVLLMGLRPQIAQRLAERGIPFVVWHDKRLRRSVEGCSRVIDDIPFPKAAEPTIRLLEQLFTADQAFSHVIAGTEASVVAASFARERFGSRATDHGMIVRCHDKRLMKAHLRNHGIPIIPYIDPLADEFTVPELIDRLGLPVVVKATNLSGRQGMVLAHSVDQLEQLWTGSRNRFTRPSVPAQANVAQSSCFAESSPQENLLVFNEKTRNRETREDELVTDLRTKPQSNLVAEPVVSCGNIAQVRHTKDQLSQPEQHSLGTNGTDPLLCESDTTSFLFERWVDVPEVSVESWIEQGQIRFSSITEYVDKTWVNLVPSRHGPEIHGRILELNHRVLEELNINWGLTHVEYFLDRDRIYLGEVAWRPPGGYLMDLISLAYDFDAWDAFVDVQLGLPAQFPEHVVRSAAAVLFHPGPGVISHIAGVQQIQADANLRQLKLLCRVGQELTSRARVSNAAAYAIFAADETDSVLRSVDRARQTLMFAH
jgi:hypothetical protein